MGAGAGIALKAVQWFNRGVQFCCAGLILALTSYFLAAMHNHGIHIPTSLRATEGISGVGVLYTAFGILLVCCLAGFTLTSFLAILLDLAFIGAFIYVATVYKRGASSCSGSNVSTVFGSGSAGSTVSSTRDGGVPLPSYRTACRMESAMLAVAIVAIVFFVISALTELCLGRHRKKEQRFGPSPANNYTSGYGRGRGGFGRLFRRNKNNGGDGGDANMLPVHTTPDQIRQSHQTEETYVNGGQDTLSHSYPKYGEAGYNHENAPATNGVTSSTMNHQQQYGNATNAAPATNTTAPAYGASYRYGDGTYQV